MICGYSKPTTTRICFMILAPSVAAPSKQAIFCRPEFELFLGCSEDFFFSNGYSVYLSSQCPVEYSKAA